MTVSDYIFKFFYEKGIDTCFCITGGHAMWLDDALNRNGKYKVIFNNHEQASAMSAEAYGRLKNKPALTLVTAAPAGLNTINGVGGGYTDSSPMIIISGQTQLRFVRYENETGIRQYGVQGINIEPICKPITKYFQILDDVTKIKYYLEKAYIKATTGRPGPVWLDVPLDIQNSVIDENIQKNYVKAEIDSVEDANVYSDMILEKLITAKRPLFVVGQGVALSGSREKFDDLIHKINVPVITTRLGIDLIETNDRLFVGRPGNYGDRAANFAVQNADLIIAVGSRLSSSSVGYNPNEWGKNAYKIVCDIDQKELDKPSINIDLKININCSLLLDSLLNKCMTLNLPNIDNWINRCESWKKNYPVCLSEYKNTKMINSYYLCDRISDYIGEGSNILVDTGSCFHVACQSFKIKKNQKFLTTGGLSSMGYWCACIGACIANDYAKTICITGDGSFLMNVQELATIKANKLPIKIFIINNNGYLLIKHTQRNYMDDRFFGTDNSNGLYLPDLIKIAESYEIKGIRIETNEELESKIKEVIDLDEPVLCDVVCDEWQYLIPRISSEKMTDGTLKAHDYSDMYPFLPRDEYERNMLND